MVKTHLLTIEEPITLNLCIDIRIITIRESSLEQLYSNDREHEHEEAEHQHYVTDATYSCQYCCHNTLQPRCTVDCSQWSQYTYDTDDT